MALELFDVSMKYEIDFGSPTWKAIHAYAQAELDRLRLENDRASLDATQTAALRGRIAAFKDLLALAAKPAPEESVDVGGHYGL